MTEISNPFCYARMLLTLNVMRPLKRYLIIRVAILVAFRWLFYSFHNGLFSNVCYERAITIC